jgi:hypothetical protein
MFNLKVTEDEIQSTLKGLSNCYTSGKLPAITKYIYGSSISIEMRKVRLCIQELRKRGCLIIATNKGYVISGDDPEPAIHFVNGLYSRAHKLTAEADIMYGLIKQKYGDEVAMKVEQLPKQPMIDFDISQCKTITREEMFGEPPFEKAYNAKGEQIEP